MLRQLLKLLTDTILAPTGLIVRRKSNWDNLTDEIDSLKVEIDSLNSEFGALRQEAGSSAVLNGSYWLRVDYPPSATLKPRWCGPQGHKRLNKLLRENQDQYVAHLTGALDYLDKLTQIPVFCDESDPLVPHYYNGWLPALDAITLYTFLAKANPHRYLEIGSGHSTKFARRAIEDHSLDTQIISIDPYPRAEIDAICDEVVRMPLENVPIDSFQRLKEGDIVVFDGSHRSFMNSDVTVFFLDILPDLEPGVFVGVHDIALPCDYSEEWVSRWYNEQYLLMAYLLGGGQNINIVLPNSFVSRSPSLLSVLDLIWEWLQPQWKGPDSPGVEPWGGYFWMQTK